MWERRLPLEGLMANRNSLLRCDNDSFYVTYRQNSGGQQSTGIAEVTYAGELRWMGIIDRRDGKPATAATTPGMV